MLAESVSDATVAAWQKQPGDQVRRGDNLVDLETDKVTLEVTAPEDGVLKEIVKAEGETVFSDEVIARLEAVAGGAGAQTPEKAPAAAARPEEKAPCESAAAPGPGVQRRREFQAEPQGGPPAEAGKSSPAVRKLIAEHDLQAAAIPGSGKDGRITKADVLRHLEERSAPGEPPSPSRSEPPAAPPSPSAVVPAAPATAAGERPEQRVAMTRLRRRTAERLLEAQQEHAILSTFNEVNMAPVMAIRERYKDRFVKVHGVKLGFMSFFAKACIEALRRFPVVNASVDGNDIVYHGYYDLGIAVSSPRGLVVPVVRDAQNLSFAEIERRISDLGDKARDGTLTMDELSGGTFTITNGGVFGSLLSTPILNPPQSAILGMHRIQDRPVAENGQAVIRPMMYLALSYDHRIIDGREAVQFLVAVKEALEDPARMLLEL